MDLSKYNRSDEDNRVEIYVIKEYINQRRKQVETHSFAGSTPMTNIMESLNIDVSMERIIWWRPFPIPNKHSL